MYNITLYKSMTSIVLLKNKRSGKIYAYVNEKVYDEMKKKDVYKRKCIGHLDPYTGEIMPNRTKRERPPLQLSNDTRFNIIENIAKEIGLKESLHASFPESWTYIMGLMTVCLFENRIAPSIRYQGISVSDIITKISHSIDSENIGSFFRIWERINYGGGYSKMMLTSYDIFDNRNYSSVMGNTELMKPQMTDSEVIVGMASMLPVYFERYSAPFKPSRESNYDIKMNEWATDEDMLHIFGISNGNQSDMEKIRSAGIPYVIHLGGGTELFDSLISKYGSDLPSGTDNELSNVRSHRTIIRNINGKKEYVHIFFDPLKAERDDATFLSFIEKCRSEIKNGHLVKDHIPFYECYFLISPESVKLNSEAIMRKTSNSGFDIVVSNREKDAESISKLMTIRGEAERNFDNLFNDDDRIMLKLYLEKNVEYRYFIQFLVLIMRAAIFNRVEGSGMSVDDVLRAIKDLKDVKDPWKKNKDNIQLTDVQKRILNLLHGSG